MLAGCSFGPPAGEPQLEPELELEFDLEPRSREIAFGDNGLVIVDDLIEPGANEFGRTMALLPGGEIAISAVVARGADLDAAIVRLSALGGVAGTSIYRT